MRAAVLPRPSRAPIRLATLSIPPFRAAPRADRAARVESVSFEAVVLVHLDAAFNLARYLARETDLAEDLVQEAVLKAQRGFARFRGGDAKAWLLTIVRREFLDWCAAKRAGAAVFAEAEPELVEQAPASEDGPEQALVRQGEIGAVRAAIESLPEPFREAIVLRELEDMSYREVAEITGAPIGTVMSRLSRAREMLARRLAPNAEGAA